MGRRSGSSRLTMPVGENTRREANPAAGRAAVYVREEMDYTGSIPVSGAGDAPGILGATPGVRPWDAGRGSAILQPLPAYEILVSPEGLERRAVGLLAGLVRLAERGVCS